MSEAQPNNSALDYINTRIAQLDVDIDTVSRTLAERRAARAELIDARDAITPKPRGRPRKVATVDAPPGILVGEPAEDVAEDLPDPIADAAPGRTLWDRPATDGAAA